MTSGKTSGKSWKVESSMDERHQSLEVHSEMIWWIWITDTLAFPKSCIHTLLIDVWQDMIGSSYVDFIQDLKLPIFWDYQLDVEIQFQDELKAIRKINYAAYIS